MKASGFIFYQGPSALEPSRNIVVIGTMKTKNAKTGDMVQVWILDADLNPLELSKRKLDASICGTCPHKHSVGGACYVNIGQAPRAVFTAFKAGRYQVFTSSDAAVFAGRHVRLGAYGDPAAMPFEIAQSIVSMSAGHTAYTHQMRHKNFDSRFLSICMVSADTRKQAARVHEAGAKTFRIATDITDMLPGEIECLSDAKGISCIDCGLCKGATTTQNIVIMVHGSRAGNFLNNRIVA